MRLEQQLDALAELGLALDEGITIDELLYSFPRAAQEQRPFDLILFVLGIKGERPPWGRAICSRVWNFDTECITATGAYVHIVQRLLRVAEPERLTEISDLVDLDAGHA
ncbi:MAG: hypothetical protein H0T73_03460 [Ardenticatenales bacterium]|nr:hypothetical protein [Ardenticatenales bacterium]